MPIALELWTPSIPQPIDPVFACVAAPLVHFFVELGGREEPFAVWAEPSRWVSVVDTETQVVQLLLVVAESLVKVGRFLPSDSSLIPRLFQSQPSPLWGRFPPNRVRIGQLELAHGGHEWGILFVVDPVLPGPPRIRELRGGVVSVVSCRMAFPPPTILSSITETVVVSRGGHFGRLSVLREKAT